MWLEDLITGDYVPYVNADVYREVTRSTSTPIHTGEQIYLRQNFKELIEKHAVSIVGPDPCDVGGIAELKWIAEYADLHGILMAPHGTGDGLLGLAALVQVCATLPHNYIAFEYPIGDPAWWYDIVDGLPDPIVKDGFIEVWDRPGMGVELDPGADEALPARGGRRLLRLKKEGPGIRPSPLAPEVGGTVFGGSGLLGGRSPGRRALRRPAPCRWWQSMLSMLVPWVSSGSLRSRRERYPSHGKAHLGGSALSGRPVPTDQLVGRAVVLQVRVVGRLQLRDHPLRQLLAQFDAPLVERTDGPDARPG